MARDQSLDSKVGRVTRQEQVVAYLAAGGHPTARAERRLASLRRTLDAMLRRRRAKAVGQGNVPSPPPAGPG